ncbi:uncharacterized protein CXQ87_003515 [Candidozyma duobushaemuli]|uniref:Uncharacterized protein n=2 Tax=Candidozyma TaxID=3303203 RepID=A0ABX8I6F1_9ASCO|nr:uncharacterized protein CXQ87_003515 [[Candida] duobushaemulonis]PVH15669.1 hypothetical protein CXQ87_003515 [[Candida] duobushaemulonis]QWU88861.1 hypothetical protein CA3LBN_003169 [[Candida] haemuloni]
MNSEKRSWHRHRRSAAISGSFDATSFVASPPFIEVANSGNSTEFRSLQLHTSSNVEANFELNNDLNYREQELVQAEDFCNCPSKESYSFPSKLQIRNERSTPVAPDSSLPKNATSNTEPSLKSRWKHVREDTSYTPRFFLTEETTLGEGNVPDAIIDLDSVSRVSQYRKNTSESYVRLSNTSGTENVFFDSFRTFDKSTSLNNGPRNCLTNADKSRKELQAHSYDHEAKSKDASNVIRQTSECCAEEKESNYDLRKSFGIGRSTSQKCQAKSNLAGDASLSGRQLDYTNSVDTINIMSDKTRSLQAECKRVDANSIPKSLEPAGEDEGSGQSDFEPSYNKIRE